MISLIIILFIIGYLIIALEHSFSINKAGTALLLGVLCWTVYALNSTDTHLTDSLSHHLSEISEILFFLLGAMTIVELIDAHDGFDLITEKITTTNKRYLLVIVSVLAFVLSAVLDNLTTAIVMATVVKKVIPEKTDRYYFLGLVIISANAGGCFSPIGDVTTTMLWVANKLTPITIITKLFIPSLVCMSVPLAFSMIKIKGNVVVTETDKKTGHISSKEKTLIFALGLACLLFVPVFKTITHLPPYMGILFGLGVMWVVTEIIHKRKDDFEKGKFSVVNAITKTDVPSVLFFLGILLAVACLQEVHVLKNAATFLNTSIGDLRIISVVIGLLSAVVDNVPLLAATMGMYDFPTDDKFWEMMAYCTGTGGSCLIIGSAAGVAVMGIENISFSWYFKNISWLAFIGYIAGFLMYNLQNFIIS
ncbi:MAG: sodium:proton antiporter NhaD [Bacteroidia bacterium]|nr:sodium:proton antiporter NhaD [Bacteroidia bacterium]